MPASSGAQPLLGRQQYLHVRPAPDVLRSLDLLGAPAGVGLAHVGRGLDGGDELEDGIGDTDQADDGARDDA